MLSTDILRTKTISPVVTFLLIFIAVIFHQRFLIIKEITCQMGAANCPEGITTLLERVKGESFLLLNQKELRNHVLSTGLVDQVKFGLKFPRKLIVTAEPPSLSFLIKMEGKTFRLLPSGVLDQTDGDSNYFLVSASIPSRDYLSEAFNWLHSLTISSMKPDAIYFLSDMIIIKRNDEPDLVVNVSDDPSEIILALQRMNQTITIKKPTVIDFRYSHPILK